MCVCVAAAASGPSRAQVKHSGEAVPEEKASLPRRMKPNINDLEDRCALRRGLLFPLDGVFTLAEHFD